MAKWHKQIIFMSQTITVFELIFITLPYVFQKLLQQFFFFKTKKCWTCFKVKLLDGNYSKEERMQRRKTIWGNTVFFSFQMNHHLIILQKWHKEKSWTVSILGQAWFENNKQFQSISTNCFFMKHALFWCKN